MNHETHYNLFHRVHHGLHAILYHYSLQLRHSVFSDNPAIAATITSLKELILLFESQTHTEDTKALCLIQQKIPEVIDEFENSKINTIYWLHTYKVVLNNIKWLKKFR